MYTQNITAIERDGLNVRTLTLSFEVPDQNFDLVKALKEACTEFVQTEEGRRIYDYNCHCFNLGDVAMSLPDDICEKHGFRKQEDMLSDITIDWDTQLVDEFALEDKEEE